MTDVKSRKSTTTDIALIAAFAALNVVGALFATIEGVPFTLQTLTVLLTGAVLGARNGALALTLYVALGAVGLPVFANAKSGFGIILGPTGGYLLSFIVAAALTGFIVERVIGKRATTNVALVFAAGLAAILFVITPLGIVGLMLNGGMTFDAAWKIAIVFVPGDIIKAIAMAFVATAVHRAFPDLLVARGK